MCLGVPGRVIEVGTDAWSMARVDFAGIERSVSLQLVPDVGVGDWVLVHAGFAIQQIDEREAEETLKLMDEMTGGHAFEQIDLDAIPGPELGGA